MNTTAKFMFAFVLLVVFLSNAVNVSAMQPDPEGVTGTRVDSLVQSDYGDRAKWLMPETKVKRGNSCTKANMPRLSYYLDDDGTPIEVAYSDYLEDLDHWRFWTDDNCNVQPESLPAQ